MVSCCDTNKGLLIVQKAKLVNMAAAYLGSAFFKRINKPPKKTIEVYLKKKTKIQSIFHVVLDSTSVVMVTGYRMFVL